MNTEVKSKAQIIDEISQLKNSLTDHSLDSPSLSDEVDNDSNINEPKKMYSVEDVMSNHINRMETFLNKQVINIYSRPWNKLELKLKIKKVEDFLLNNNNNDNDGEPLDKNKIIHNLKTNNKKLKIVYDKDQCCITEIKCS